MATSLGKTGIGTGRRANVLLVTMAGATYGLILLGIYTAAVGAGLTCDGRWPLCDGAVFGLFPANWPSFVEWFHRLIAMITGFLILGGWAIIWRGGTSRRARIAMTVAVALLPIQIWLGAETVWGYEIVTLTAHFLTALVIYTGILLAVTWHFSLQHEISQFGDRIVAGALLMLVPFFVLTPQFLVVHSGRIQVIYYGLGLAVFTGVLLVAIAPLTLLERLLAGLGALLITVQLLVGRLMRTPDMAIIDWTAGGILVLVLVGLLMLTRKGTSKAATPQFL